MLDKLRTQNASSLQSIWRSIQEVWTNVASTALPLVDGLLKGIAVSMSWLTQKSKIFSFILAGIIATISAIGIKGILGMLRGKEGTEKEVIESITKTGSAKKLYFKFG